MRAIRAGLCYLLAMLLAGCGGSTPQVPQQATAVVPAEAALDMVDIACPDAAGPISGPLVFGSQNNLIAIGADGAGQAALTTTPTGIGVGDPAWSPDGQTLAFTLSYTNPQPEMTWFMLSKICAFDRASGKGRTLLAGRAMTALEHPAWNADGRSLLTSVRRYRFDEQGQPLGELLTIARFDLATGVETTLLEQAKTPAVSPDGARLSYVQVDPQNYALTIMVAGADGSNPAPVFAPKDPLTTVQEPRWSPDGRRIAFSMSVDGEPAGAVERPAASASLLDWLLGVQVARAHGLSANIWVVGADGQGPLQVTKEGLDEPRAAWSPDGTRLAYTSGLGALTTVDLATGAQQQLAGIGDHGGISWARQ